MFELVPFDKRRSGLQRKMNSLFDFDNLFESFFNDSFFPAFYRNSADMKVDIRETDKEYILEAELPGLKKDDINIDITDDRLTISVNKEETKEEERHGYIRKERRSSSICRSFAIYDVDADKASGKFENGLLTLILPKKEKADPKGRRINIE